MAESLGRSDASGKRKNQYFVPGEGIAREVITADICKYLDNDATVRPGEYMGRQGYYVYAYRNLTTEMMEDLKADSRRWEAEKAEKARHRQSGRGGADRYEDSNVHHRRQEVGPTYPQTYGHNEPWQGHPTDYSRPQQPSPYDDSHNNQYTTSTSYQQNQQTGRNDPYQTGYAPDPRQPNPIGGGGPSYVTPRTQPNQWNESYQDPSYAPIDPRYQQEMRDQRYAAPYSNIPGQPTYPDTRTNIPNPQPIPLGPHQTSDARFNPYDSNRRDIHPDPTRRTQGTQDIRNTSSSTSTESRGYSDRHGRKGGHSSDTKRR